jgi:predicted Zn-dependent protease
VAPPSAPLYRALTTANLWLGRASAAVATAEQAVTTAGGSLARRDLALANFHAGKLAEAERMLRALEPSQVAAELATLAALRGRRREALHLIDGGDPAWAPYYRAALLVGDGDPAAVWTEARQLRVLEPGFAPNLAVALAYRDDLEHAAQLAAGLRPGTPIEAIYKALVAWKRGDFAQAKTELRAAAARNRLPPNSLPPAFLLGEVCAAAGDQAEAIEALKDYLALPYFGIWQGWARPRSLYLLARAHERLGQRAQALARVDELLALWRDADPDLATLAQARALRERLRPSRAAPPPRNP